MTYAVLGETAGRPAISIQLRTDYPTCARAVLALPGIAQERGADSAILWGMTYLPRFVAPILIGRPETEDEEHSLEFVLTAISDEAFLRLLCSPGRERIQAEMDLLHHLGMGGLLPAVRHIFHSTAPLYSPSKELANVTR